MRRIQLVLKLSIHSNVGVGLCSTRWFWYYATPVAGVVEPRPYNVVGVLRENTISVIFKLCGILLEEFIIVFHIL